MGGKETIYGRMAMAAPSKPTRPLFEGGKLRCPHDKQLHDVLSYKRFDVAREFEAQLNTVLKCEACGHVFSPYLTDDEMNVIMEAFDAN